MGSSVSDPPLIGLSTYVETARFGVWEEKAALLPLNYVSAVIRSGGTPVLLPPSPAGPGSVLRALHGLVVTGGPDVDPARYGEPPHSETDRPRPERDAWEAALCQAALDMDLPLLAVCRGLQVLNVSQGGTLHQHLPDMTGNTDHRKVMGQMTPNQVTIDGDSRLADLLGTEAEVMCHHHQGVDRLGKDMTAIAYSSDGTVEAADVAGHRYALGVQWHPETNESDDRLFKSLVEAAAAYRRENGS